jgi:hypothetical protein
MTVPSGTIDPATNGLRILITAPNGQAVVDATVPPGVYNSTTNSGWKVNGSQTTFVYKNLGGTITSLQGVNKVLVKRITKVPGQFRFTISAIGGSYPIPSSLPVKGTVILQPPYAADNQCGDAVFPGPTSPACAFGAPAGTVMCKSATSARRPGPRSRALRAFARPGAAPARRSAERQPARPTAITYVSSSASSRPTQFGFSSFFWRTKSR